MAELSRQQKAGITRRDKTRNAFLGTAADIFSARVYSDVQAIDVIRHSGISSATFYSMFPAKSAWAAAVLDARLNEALDQQQAPGDITPRARALGHLVLLGEVAAPLPGITKSLVDERTVAQVPYTELLPRYYSEFAQVLRDGQEKQVFRADLEALDMADFALDSLAMEYSVHLDNPATRTMGLPPVILDGFAVRD